MAVLQGIPYSFQGPDGTYAVFNAPADTNFVGYLSDPPAGLDGPPIRERAYDLVDSDGGRHGEFFASRRPVAFSGFIMPSGVAAVDEDRQNRLLNATYALGPQHRKGAYNGDALLFWTEAVRGSVQLWLRTQQPTRLAGRRPKTFTVSMVSADHRIVSQALHAVTTTVSGSGAWDFTIANTGNAPADWHVDLAGGAGGSLLHAATLEIFSDAGRTKAISRTAWNPSAFGIADQPTGPGQFLIFEVGRDQADPGIAPSTMFSTVNGDVSGGVIFDPLNWQPAGPATTYGRLSYIFTSGGANASFYFRDSWGQ